MEQELRAREQRPPDLSGEEGPPLLTELDCILCLKARASTMSNPNTFGLRREYYRYLHRTGLHQWSGWDPETLETILRGIVFAEQDMRK